MPLPQLFLALYILFALATPVLVIALYVRYTKLQQRLKQLEDENARQAVTFTHELAELKRQAAAPRPAAPDKPISPEPAKPSTAQTQAPIPSPIATPASIPTPSPIPVVPNPAAPAIVPPMAVPPKPVAPPEPAAPPLAAQESKSGEPRLKPAEPKPPVPAEATEQKPVVPVAASVPVDAKAHGPAPPAPPIAPPKPPVETRTAIPPAAAVPPDVAVSARVIASPAFQGLRVPPSGLSPRTSATKPTMQQQMKKMSALEETLGTNWLTKLGIAMLVIGLALLGILELKAMGPGGRAALLFAIALVLLIGGIFLESRERYRLLGRAGIGGGWALLFFSTFAIYHVPPMHVLDSLIADSVLMLLVAVAMAVHTLRYRSQFVTGLAFLLAYTTVALSYSEVLPLSQAGVNQTTAYGLLAGVILAIGLVSIVRKMGWYELEVFGILSSYLNHLYWLYRILGIEGAQGRAFPEYGASTAMLFFYWLMFRISFVARHTRTDFEEHVSTAAAVLNSALLLGLLRFQSVHPELAYVALLAVGALELAFGQMVKRRREGFVVLTVMGAALLLAAAPTHYAGSSGHEIAILWLVGTEVFLITGVLVKEVVFRRIGLFTGLLVGLRLASSDLRELITARMSGEEVLVGVGILFALCGVVFYLNVFGFGTRKKEFFERSPDDGLLTAHSYLGAVSAAAAAWALATQDWTAVALAAVMLAQALLGRGFASRHLQVQYAAMGIAAMYRAVAINLHVSSGEGVHVKMRLITLPIVGGAFYLTAKVAALRDNAEQKALRGFFAACGTLLFALLIWYEGAELWRPVLFVVFAVLLSEVARALRYPLLTWHTHLLAALALLTGVSADELGAHLWHKIPVRDFSALVVIAGFYWLARRLGTAHEQHLKAAKACYTWAAAGLMMWVLSDALNTAWVAVAWIVFAVALVLARRWTKYAQLAWQANVVAVSAGLWTLSYNYEIEEKLWLGISVRLVTVSLVAAGLYFIARTAAPSERWKVVVPYFHSFAATGLLALLAWYEEPNGWLAPLWAAFALVLALIDRRWQRDELRWQAHALSLIALMRCVVFNLHLEATWHDLSIRLLSLSLVAVIFYATSRLVRMPQEWRARDMHHIYSWAASALVSAMLWFELRPLSIAVGWAVFGLVLFEYGLLRRVVQFRYQAYVALAASFVRIFFANLSAGTPGEFWSPRTYTILPLALIFFFVYAQLPEEASPEEREEGTESDHRLHFDALLACLGSASIVALFYFQFDKEWVVTSWAAVVLVLFGIAFAVERAIFLYQGMILTVLTVARGLAHNLFGASYHSEHDWQGRYVVLSLAAALLLASLAFAFPLRERFRARVTPNSGAAQRGILALVRRPEQLQFFSALLLLTLMLAKKLDAGMVTVAWGIEGVLVILLALALNERSFRLTGLGLLLLCVGKVLAMDAWRLQPRDRYVTFIIVGAALLLVSYLYTRYREAIRQFL
jgi:hypothetical protein